MKVASKVAGRVASVAVQEGARVQVQQVVVTLETTDTDLALAGAQAERDQATAQLRLLQAGSRPEDIQQAQAQVQAAEADRRAADADLTAARQDEARFDQLLENNAGSQKQRDDAVARRAQTEARLKAAGRSREGRGGDARRVKAGARRRRSTPRGRAWPPRRPDRHAPARPRGSDDRRAGRRHRVLAPRRAGELVAPGHAAARRRSTSITRGRTAYVDEPLVPPLQIDQAATVVTDAGDRLAGTITFISPKAEFTPRNVQTADERVEARVSRQSDGRQPRRACSSPACRSRSSLRRRPPGNESTTDADRRRRARSASASVRRRRRRVDGVSFDVAPRRDVRRDRSGRRRQDDDAAADLRAAARPTRARCACSAPIPFREHGGDHGVDRLPLAALQPLRRSVDRREHRVLRRDPRRPAFRRAPHAAARADAACVRSATASPIGCRAA